MILLWEAVVLELGVHGLQTQTQKVWFAENLSKNLDNPCKNGAQHCLLQKVARKVCIKTHEDLSLEVTSKRGFHDLCGRKFLGKSCAINFSGKFAEIRAKSSAP